MNGYDSTDCKGTDRRRRPPIDERDRKALSQYLTVLPDAPGLFEVVSESGKAYTVDSVGGACTCPDFEYRGVFCKQQRRVAFETGARPLPADVDRDALPSDFGRHVDGEPCAVATDGGRVLDREPTVEYTRHVEPPEQGGEEYVRCEGCGAEILLSLGGRSALIHREGCPVGEGR